MAASVFAAKAVGGVVADAAVPCPAVAAAVELLSSLSSSTTSTLFGGLEVPLADFYRRRKSWQRMRTMKRGRFRRVGIVGSCPAAAAAAAGGDAFVRRGFGLGRRSSPWSSPPPSRRRWSQRTGKMFDWRKRSREDERATTYSD